MVYKHFSSLQTDVCKDARDYWNVSLCFMIQLLCLHIGISAFFLSLISVQITIQTMQIQLR